VIPERPAHRFRPTVAQVDLDAVRHNVASFVSSGVEVMAVVKANGYGHGDVPVGRAAVDAGATWLGVALVEEGLRLREAGLDVPILVLAQMPPGSEPYALEAGLTPTLYSDDALERLVACVEGHGGARPAVHVKVDTGMHRVGMAPAEVPGFLRRVERAGLPLEGLWTHLAVSDDLEHPFTVEQLGRFDAVLEAMSAAGLPRPRYLHAAATAGAIAWPQARFDMVRVGLGVYGIAPAPALEGCRDLRPAMTWRSRVSFAKRVAAGERLSYGLRYTLPGDAWVATVPVGYADGYPRCLSCRSHVLIGGRRRLVAGTVTMDQLLVDCGDDEVREGDEVVLIGRQGDQEVTASELAALAGTIPYEVVCAVSERVPRTYVGEP
jgi:alanine racemase